MTDMGKHAEQVRQVLDANGWWGGKAALGGRNCLGMAIYSVLRGQEADVVCGAVMEIIRDLFPERTMNFPADYTGNLWGNPVIPFFNDHEDTTLEDVILVLKHLAEK